MQLQLKNACSVRMSVTFTFLAHMYYAAILNHGTMYTFFFPQVQCYACDAADLILPCPGHRTSLSVTPTACTVLPKRNSSLAGGAVSHELVPAPVEGITP